MSYETPLFYRNRQGSLCWWRVWADGPFICTEYGLLGGAVQFSTRRATPKNAGKKNATTSEQQAIREAEALWQNRVERKYRESVEEAQEPLRLPMLAKDYWSDVTQKKPSTQAKALSYPVFVQPKLDGARAVAFAEDGKFVLKSRSGKVWDVPHVAAQLEKLFPAGGSWVLDGELYIHQTPFQDLMSLAKRNRPESAALEYHIYDAPVANGGEDLPFRERWQTFSSYFADTKYVGRTIAPVHTRLAEAEREVIAFEAECVRGGYEGAMVRVMDAIYEWGYRSPNLLKVKSFDEAEFVVIGAGEGDGAAAGCVVWTCVVPSAPDDPDCYFRCTMRCGVDERRRYFLEREKYIGQRLTVSFFGKSNDGIPRFPRGIKFRDEKDLQGRDE